MAVSYVLYVDTKTILMGTFVHVVVRLASTYCLLLYYCIGNFIRFCIHYRIGCASTVLLSLEQKRPHSQCAG